jgi:hypothetical protein
MLYVLTHVKNGRSGSSTGTEAGETWLLDGVRQSLFTYVQ